MATAVNNQAGGTAGNPPSGSNTSKAKRNPNPSHLLIQVLRVHGLDSRPTTVRAVIDLMLRDQVLQCLVKKSDEMHALVVRALDQRNAEKEAHRNAKATEKKA